MPQQNVEKIVSEEEFCKQIEFPTMRELCERLGINGDENDPRRKIIFSQHPYTLFKNLFSLGYPLKEVMYQSTQFNYPLQELITFLSQNP
jgi:hypothetical protein